ncbi:MAG TPA: hypothetical protein VH087_12335, partial [Thermoanaerobaculia bacterium]|nr:hypothetical protein [Thermoanaerobaculia bacterium]
MIVLIAIVLLACPLQAGVDTILAHGVQPNSTYQVSQFDSVNTFSGDLNVNIPFGPQYKTNGTLSYQFGLQHSRDIWAFVDRYAVNTAPSTITTTVVDAGAVYDSAGVRTYRMTFTLDAPEGSGFAGSEPVPAGNAGMGWDVGFGSFGAVPLPESYLGGIYTDESGAAHEFHPSMHSTSFNDVGASFTQDGSYLRLRIVDSNTNEREVDFPNGTIKHFSCVSACGTRKAQWILRWISDPFGNALVVERSSDTRPASGQWIWTLTEGTLPDAETRSDPYYHGSAPERTSLIVNRQHRLTFDIYGNFAQTDYPWIGERLSKAELAGPSGDFSMIFSFAYDPLTMLRTSVLPWTGDGLFFPYNAPANTSTFQTLTSMTLPEGAGTWKFSYYPGSTNDGNGISYTYCTSPNWNSNTPCPSGFAYPTSRIAGALKSVKAPTGGGYQYTYTLRGLPVRLCGVQAKDAPGYGGGAMIGLSKREEIDENGTVKATWYYSGQGYFRHFVDADHDGFDDGDLNKNGVYDAGDVPICRAPVEFLAAVLDPNGLLTIDYHNAAYGLAWYGAPFSPDPDRTDTIQRHDGSQMTRYMSSETYSVDNSSSSPFVTNLGDAVRRLSRTYRDDNETAPMAARLRAKYAVFDESGYDCSGEGLPSDCRQINLRETSEHTRYYDDPATITFGGTMTNQVPYTETVHSDFDGLGHFRQTNTYGTLKAAAKPQRIASDFDVRGEYTFFNPKVTWQAGSNNPTGMPDRLSSWLNELSTRTMIVENGRIGSSHTLFDSLRGYTKAVRRLKESSLSNGVALIPDGAGNAAPLKDVDVGDGADDLLTIYTRTGAVSDNGPYEVTVREDSYGGDGGGLCTSTSGECAWSGGQLVLGSATADYSSETTSQYGGVVSSVYRGCNDAPYVHSSSAAIEHGAGLPSSVTDASGLTTGYTYDTLGRVTLVTPPGAATPQAYAYQSKTGIGAMNSLAITRSGGPSTTYVYDYLGRLLMTTQDTPAGPATSAITYTPTGKVLDQTPPLAVRSNHHSYDVFDRETSVRGADSHITDTSYVGGRGTLTLMHDVATNTANHDVQISHDLDSFGRLFRANDGLLKAEYDYDALSNLTVVTLTDIAKGDTQTRRIDHDGRGFVNSETNPEMHGSGGQVIVKNVYDARGHVTSRDFAWSGGADASALSHWSLRMAYDPAERLRDVWQPGTTAPTSKPPLKHIEYFSDGDSIGSRNQPSTAVRYNYVPDPAMLLHTATYKVTKSYNYDGCAAGSVRCGLLTQEITMMSKVSDTGVDTAFLSGTVNYDYDARGNLIKTDYPAPFADAVARSINYGYTADVVTGLTEGAAHTPRASITYYKNGQRAKVQLANANAHDDIDLDSDSMLARPGKITWNWTGGSSTSDLYAYDGAGNISKIGSDTFHYDKALRLIDANVSSVYEGYTYDGFGNLTKRGNVTYTVGTSDNHLASAVYDEAGDLTSMADGRMLNPPDPAAKITFQYDPLQRATYTDGNGIGRVYVYDPDDERAGVINFKASGGSRELWSFRSFDHRVLRDVERKFNSGTPTWTWKKDYVYAGDLLTNTFDRNASGQVEVRDVHVDHLGSVRFVTGPSGELLNTSSSGAKFLPFGSLAFDQNLQERLAFTGHERDDDGSAQDEGDFDYMHARYYSPYLGR